jgi:hypothetical protein
VLRLGDTVYVYGTQSPRVSDPFRHLYLARVPVTQLTTFSSWRFYAGAGAWATGQQSARPVSLGQVRLSWPDAGLGLRYLIYLHGPGQPGTRPVTTAYHDGATLTGLRPGSYVARVVPANLRKYKGRGR